MDFHNFHRFNFWNVPRQCPLTLSVFRVFFLPSSSVIKVSFYLCFLGFFFLFVVNNKVLQLRMWSFFIVHLWLQWDLLSTDEPSWGLGGYSVKWNYLHPWDHFWALFGSSDDLWTPIRHFSYDLASYTNLGPLEINCSFITIIWSIKSKINMASEWSVNDYNAKYYKWNRQSRVRQ